MFCCSRIKQSERVRPEDVARRGAERYPASLHPATDCVQDHVDRRKEEMQPHIQQGCWVPRPEIHQNGGTPPRNVRQTVCAPLVPLESQ